jgi:hypothetical protein
MIYQKNCWVEQQSLTHKIKARGPSIQKLVSVLVLADSIAHLILVISFQKNVLHIDNHYVNYWEVLYKRMEFQNLNF